MPRVHMIHPETDEAVLVTPAAVEVWAERGYEPAEPVEVEPAPEPEPQPEVEPEPVEDDEADADDEE